MIEPADADDAERVVDLWVDLAAGQRMHGSHLLADDNRAVVRETVARYAVTGNLLVARDRDGDPDDPGGRTAGDRNDTADGDDAGIVGFVMFALESGGYAQDVTRGIVENLYVIGERRDEGVGTALLESAERALVAAGADTLALEVMADNEAARRFYRRHGYDPHRVELEKAAARNDTHTRE